MNICLVSQEYPRETGWGGIGTYTYEMAHGLAQMGHKVYVLSRATHQAKVYDESNGVMVYRILPRFNPSNVPVLWRLNRFWEGYHLAVALQLRKIVRTHHIDVIEAPTLHGETLGYQIFTKTPTIMRLHTFTPKEVQLNDMAWRPSMHINFWCEKQVIKNASKITAPSNAIVRDSQSILQNKALHIIPNPINVQRFELNTSSDESLGILFLGRFDKRKGIETFIQAIIKVWQVYPGLPVTLVGKDGFHVERGSMKKQIEYLVNHLPNPPLKFLDWVTPENIIGIYQRAMIVAFPSVWEPFGYVCVEAMACGKPVVATTSGGPEEIIVNGETGLLTPPNDVDALAEAFINLVRQPSLRKTFGTAGYQRALKKYDISIIIPKMLDIYQSIL